MKTRFNKSDKHQSGWYQSIKVWFLELVRRLTKWKLVNTYLSIWTVRGQYHSLLRESRKNLLKIKLVDSSPVGIREESERRKYELEQIRMVREVYKRSVQRLYDIVLFFLVASIIVYLISLATRTEPTVTVRIGIYSNSVDLQGVLPTWSMNGAIESDQILFTDKSINLANVDRIKFNHEKLVVNGESGFKLKSIDKNGRPSRLNLYGISFRDSTAHLSLETKDDALYLSVGADRHPISIKGILCKNGCFGNLVRDGIYSELDPDTPIEFEVEAAGHKRVELAFSKIPVDTPTPEMNSLRFRWEDIPFRDAITFSRPTSDTTDLSTIESGWVYILQTNDTIKLSKHDFLRMRLANISLASISVPMRNMHSLTADKLVLFTEATCQVNELRTSTGRGEFKSDLMPKQIEVMAEQKDQSLLYAIVGLLATLFIPVIFRNRL